MYKASAPTKKKGVKNMMELAIQNLISPVVLCFVLGVVAQWVKSDFKLPDAVYQSLSIY